ncbi:DUF3267 domain-containing protein [Flavobacterium sp. PL12]|uniref:DUF3267 domain-containing protein n=1 Tax=Flavobacterium sp. PL12 TaxID=3071718 RepID=UPI00319DEC91
MKEVIIRTKVVNILAFVTILPITAAIIIPFCIKWGSTIKFSIKIIKTSLSIFNNKLLDNIIIIITPIILIFTAIIIHELIHCLFMAIFSKNGIKSVNIGIKKETLVLYAHCSEPLMGKKMLIVSLAPFVILGIFPTIYAFIFGNLIACFIGLSMSIGAIGDLIYSYLILKTGLKKMMLDHGSEIGFRIID